MGVTVLCVRSFSNAGKILKYELQPALCQVVYIAAGICEINLEKGADPYYYIVLTHSPKLSSQLQ